MIKAMKYILFITVLFFFTACPSPSGDSSGLNGGEVTESSITIQENSTLVTKNGFVSTTGIFDNNKAGFTGDGFIGYLGADSSIVYTVKATLAGTYSLYFRYANQDNKLTNATDRDANIIVNGVKIEVSEGNYALACPPTGDNPTKGDLTVWENTEKVSIELDEGDNDIRIIPNGVKLPNLDCLVIEGSGLNFGDNSRQFFTLNVDSLDALTGSVTLSPEQEYYEGNTEVTCTATAVTGYEFSSWTGSHPSVEMNYTFNISEDTNLSARFLPTGTLQQVGLMGYAAVQDDLGTPYILTGGLGGDEITVTTLAELTVALTSTDPKIVIVKGLITTPTLASVSINVTSNTTIISDSTTQGHLKNIELKLSEKNYIIKDLIISEVIADDSLDGIGNDCIQLNGAEHVWVDHCEIYSNTVNGKDYYDGLLDIKNGARFITLSNNYFHDHYKAILVGSGDDISNKPVDSKIRLTMYKNYLHNTNSRTPLIRYGKAHIVNNYYYGEDKQIDSTVNARCESEVFVENNYFKNCKYTVGFFYDTSGYATGKWNMSGNVGESLASSLPNSTTSWIPSYSYETPEPATSLPSLIISSAGVSSK